MVHPFGLVRLGHFLAYAQFHLGAYRAPRGRKHCILGVYIFQDAVELKIVPNEADAAGAWITQNAS